MQSITTLPDMIVEIKYYVRLVVQNGCATIYLWNEEGRTWAWQGSDYWCIYNSLAEFLLSTQGGKKRKRTMEFIQKLESHTSYDIIAEYCASEIENSKVFGDILMGFCTN